MLKRLEQDRIADIERIDILQIKVAKPFEQLLELGGKTVARQLASKMEITRDRRDSRNVYQVAYEDYSAEDLSQYALVLPNSSRPFGPMVSSRRHGMGCLRFAVKWLRKARLSGDGLMSLHLCA